MWITGELGVVTASSPDVPSGDSAAASFSDGLAVGPDKSGANTQITDPS